MTFGKDEQDKKIKQQQEDQQQKMESNQKVGQNLSNILDNGSASGVFDQDYNIKADNYGQDANLIHQFTYQQQQSEEMKQFLIKLFQNDEIRSLSDARMAIEQKFESSFKPDRDLLDYLIDKQRLIRNSNKNKKNLANSKLTQQYATQGAGNRILEQFNAIQQQQDGNNIRAGLGRSKSNVSMKEYQDEYEAQDEADVDSDDQVDELQYQRRLFGQDIERQQQQQLRQQQLFNDMSDQDHEEDVDEHLETDDIDQHQLMMDIDEGSFDIQAATNVNNTATQNRYTNSTVRDVKKSKFLISGSDDGEQDEEEEKQSHSKYKKQMSMMEKCKQVGRVGPFITKLHLEESKGQIRQFDHNGLDIEAMSQFASVRANTAVFKGKYYYEVRLLSAGVMQIGWCTLVTPFNEQNGVGDDSTSYAYDGCRIKKWNQSQQRYGKQWQVGDIIGTLIDLERREITFYRNDECLGVAFRDVKVGPNMAYFPAVSLSGGQRVVFNFGAHIPFRARQSFEVNAIQEPENQIKSYQDCAFYLIETVKRYVMQCQEQQALSIDSKLVIGSIIWEYLYPLLINDSYLMEDQLVQFIFELVSIAKQELIDIIIDSWEIHFSTSQLAEWMQLLMSILCRKISNISLINADNSMKREFELSHMKFIVQLLQRDTFLNAWLCSNTLFQDLENLYFLHLPNDQEIQSLIPQVYHELIPGTERFKQQYNQALEKIMTNIKIQQNYWFQITDLLFQKRKLEIIPEGQIEKSPREIYLGFLKYLVNKNIGYLKNNKPPGLTTEGTLGNVFFCAVRQMDNIVYNKPLQMFPFETFFAKDQQMSFSDEAFKHLERIGGTYSYMENELSNKLKEFEGKSMSGEQQEMSMLAKNLTLIYSFTLIQGITVFIKANEKVYVNSRTYDDLTERGKIESGPKFIEEMIFAAKILPQFQMIINIDSNRVSLHKFAFWLSKSLNYIDREHPEIIYILPEEFIQIPFDIFRAWKRGNLPLYISENDKIKYRDEYEQIYSNENTTFVQEMIQFISKHFFDAKIVNPDLKELYLTRLNIMMQSQIFINIFEQCPQAQQTLIPDLMRSFDKKYLLLVSKNFLRFSKGRGFKEIHLSPIVSENTYSPIFLQKIREQLLIPGDKLTKEFMNVFFNTLNETTTELFVIFKELKNSYNGNLLKRTRLNFSLVVDLYRIMEVLTKVAPELFVDKMHIHSIRLINYMMFVLHSIFIGQLDNYIDFFSNKIMQRSESLAQFLAPFIGILKNLYDAVNALGNKDNVRFDNLADIFQKTDSFDPILFLKLKEIVKGQLPAQNQDEESIFQEFDTMLDEIDMLCQCNKIRKHSLRSQDSESDNIATASNNQGGDNNVTSGHGAEEEFDEEKLCNICYFTEKDTVFVPCGHQTCFKCIQVHTQNSEKCPFCNTEIKEIKKIK